MSDSIDESLNRAEGRVTRSTQADNFALNAIFLSCKFETHKINIMKFVYGAGEVVEATRANHEMQVLEAKWG